MEIELKQFSMLTLGSQDTDRIWREEPINAHLAPAGWMELKKRAKQGTGAERRHAQMHEKRAVEAVCIWQYLYI